MALRTTAVQRGNVPRFTRVMDHLRNIRSWPSLPGINRINEVTPPELIHFRYDDDLMAGPGILNPNLAVGIIGAATNHTKVGRQVAEQLARATVEFGGEKKISTLIVAGGAFGIDRAAHRGAIEAGGMTAAVVQNLVEYGLSPRGHTALAKNLNREIPQHGGFVSHYFTKGRPSVPRALGRNFITSALSDLMIVVECASQEHIGTVDNALKALLQGVPVMVLDWTKLNFAGFGPATRTGNDFLLDGNFSDLTQTPLFRFPEKEISDFDTLAREYKRFLETFRPNR